MSDDSERLPSHAERAMAANADSRNRQARHQANQIREQQSGSESSKGRGGEQLQQSIEESFSRSARPADIAAIKASKAKSAELLREASDLLADRTNDA